MSKSWSPSLIRPANGRPQNPTLNRTGNFAMRFARNTVVAVCTSILFAGPAAAADVLAEWNEFALNNIGPGRPLARFGPVGPAVTIDLALVHLAMHDAVQAYDQRFDTYAERIPDASGSPVVAAAKAAHDVLAERLKDAPLVVAIVDARYVSYIGTLSPMPSAADIAAGEAVGAEAARRVLALRDNDGSFPPVGTFDEFTGGTGVGEWRPNPNTPGMVAPWLGAVRPLAKSRSDTENYLENMDPEPIPALTSLEYAEAYNEVLALGSASPSAPRSDEQNEIARFFSGNSIAIFNRLMRDLVAGADDLASLGDGARLFALANMAAADGIICAWENKKRYNFWRPIHAIRGEGAHGPGPDGNTLTIGDPEWTPLLATPNYPDYTSGFNIITGAMTGTMTQYFGSDRPLERQFELHFYGPSSLPPQSGDPNPRLYTRFSDVQQDVIVARVYQGIHFRFADTEARSQGERIAHYVFRHMLTPIQ